MLDWTPAHQHATGAGAGGFPTSRLPQTCRRLKLGLQSASIELSGGYFCFLRDNILLEDEKEPGTPMNFPYHNGGAPVGQWYSPPPSQMGAQSGQTLVIAQDQSAGGSDSQISEKSQGKNQQKKR